MPPGDVECCAGVPLRMGEEKSAGGERKQKMGNNLSPFSNLSVLLRCFLFAKRRQKKHDTKLSKSYDPPLPGPGGLAGKLSAVPPFFSAVRPHLSLLLLCQCLSPAPKVPALKDDNTFIYVPETRAQPCRLPPGIVS